MYCFVCPRFKTEHICRGCLCDARHNTCDIYECCVELGGKRFCFECEYFPCERLNDFVQYNHDKKFAHFRHRAIDNLRQMKEVGPECWLQEINQHMRKDENDGRTDSSTHKDAPLHIK